MIEMVLIGGPYDGAAGPHEYAGESALWIYPDAAGRGRNGLWIAVCPRPLSVRYRLAGADVEGRVRYFCDGVVMPELHRELAGCVD